MKYSWIVSKQRFQCILLTWLKAINADSLYGQTKTKIYKSKPSEKRNKMTLAKKNSSENDLKAISNITVFILDLDYKNWTHFQLFAMKKTKAKKTIFILIIPFCVFALWNSVEF